VQTDEPYLLFSHYMYDLPISSLSVELLDGCSVGESFIADCVNISLGKCAAVGSPHCL